MSNQNRTARVETRCPSHGDDAPANALALDPQLRAFGRAFDTMFRQAVKTMANRCAHVPAARRQAIYDMARPDARTVSVEVAGMNIGACVFDGTLSDIAVEEFSLTIECWLRTKLAAPLPLVPIESVAETKQQSVTDVEQMFVCDAIERGDHAAVVRFRHSLTEYIARGKRLLTAVTYADLRMRLANRSRSAH